MNNKKSKCLVCNRIFIPSPHSAGMYCSPDCYHSVPKGYTLEEAFWKYVYKTPNCWFWIGWMKGSNQYAYGGVGCSAYRGIRAHRASWIIHKGPIPKGKFVLHTCDNPQCVNPEHLFLGTAKDNTEDCRKKGRLSAIPDNKGEKNGISKLTTKKVKQIRTEYDHKNKKSNGMALAKKYGISFCTVYNIIRNESWKHIA
jgi:hypothetical protein